MNALFLSSALAVMAAYLIVASEQGDEARAFKLSRVKYRKFAANIDDRSKLRDRLLELNRTSQHEYLEFRSSQIATAFLTFVVFALLIWAKSASFAGALIIGVIAGYFAFAFIDRNLTKAVVKRRAQMDAEFPALIEMLTLSISAGQTPLNAMATIAARSECELATEFAVVTKDVIAGAPFHIALDAMGRRIKSVTIRRFIDAMITAMLRGAPIVEVLQRHAQESRTAHRNQIMAAAGKAEIAMMIPVVFLILPVSMLFCALAITFESKWLYVVVLISPPNLIERGNMESMTERNDAPKEFLAMRILSSAESAITKAAIEAGRRINRLRNFDLVAKMKDERGDVPGWVLVVLMTTGLVTAIWTIAAPRLTTILKNSLNAMNGIR